MVLTPGEDGECRDLGAAISVIIRRRAGLCEAVGPVWGVGRPCAVLWPGSAVGLRCGETRLEPEPEGPVPGLCGGVGHRVLGEEAAMGYGAVLPRDLLLGPLRACCGPGRDSALPSDEEAFQIT